MERGEHSGLVCTRQVNCCGSVVAAEEAEVQRVMTAAGLFADAQAREWLRLAHEYTDPDWMELCMARARRAMQIVHDEREIGSQIVSGGKNAWAAAPSFTIRLVQRIPLLTVLTAILLKRRILAR